MPRTKHKQNQYNRLRDLYPGLPEEFTSSALDTLLTLALNTKIELERMKNERIR